MCKMSPDSNAIADFTQRQGITRLVHFTPFLNLCGIFNRGGIWPRVKLEDYNKKNPDEDIMAYINWNDKLRLDGRNDCINLSIQRINSFLFARFKGFPHGKPWCLLEVNPICLQCSGVLFTVANAASTWVKHNGTQGGVAGLKKLYADKVWDGKRLHERTKETPINCPTSRQAEVLYPGVIDISLINGLVFATNEDAAQAKAMLMTDCSNLALPQVKVVPCDFT